MTVSYNYSIMIIINAYLSGFRIGFENTSYIVNEGIGMFQVCVVMFEPPEDTPLGTLTVSIGVETVQGTAGIVCRDAVQHCMSIAFCLIHRWK